MTDKENRIPGKTDRESFTGHRTGREEGEIKVERKSRLIPYEVANTISFSVCVCVRRGSSWRQLLISVSLTRDPPQQ